MRHSFGKYTKTDGHRVGVDGDLNPCNAAVCVVDYQPTFDAMKRFTAERTAETEDEIWLLQHPPVYTQGLTGRPSMCSMRAIPVIQIDRGGQVTYHGPGQGSPIFL